MPKLFRKRIFAGISSLLTGLELLAIPAHAHTPLSMNRKLCPLKPGLEVPIYPGKRIHAKANQVTLKRHGISVLTGRAQISEGNQTLLSDRIEYNQQTEEAFTPLAVTLKTPQMWLHGQRGRFNLASHIGTLAGVRYRYNPTHAQGVANRADLRGRSLTILRDATYSACPVGREAWSLAATKVRLDHKTDIGTARNVVLYFQGLPILYTPYLSFSLSRKRKSGLLPPMVGESSTSGFIYRQPIYWNIDPQADATFTPEIFGRRGVGLDTQFRYLSPHADTVTQGNYLPQDRTYGASRWLYSFNQKTNPLPGWQTHINYNRASDDNYFTDLGNQFTSANVTLLQQNAAASYQAPHWSFNARVEKYQNLNPLLGPAQVPYQLLPQLNFHGWLPAQPFGLQFSDRVQWTRFLRSDSVTGTRLIMTPEINLPLSGAYGFLTPTLRYRFIKDHLTNQSTGNSASPALGIPMFSIHGGLYFERYLRGDLIQTLEPEAYYLYAPYRNQQDLPVFDTITNIFSYSRLFADNRFAGGDRVGDANQLSLALTTRIINTDTGEERLRASIGQILYFRSRKVTLHGTPAQTAHRSDYAGRLFVNINENWNATASLAYNPYNRLFNYAYNGVQYHLSHQQLINLGYQFNRGRINQSDMSFIWPLNAHWQAAGRWDYSLQNHRTLDVFAGLEYDSCCWAVHFLARRYVTTVHGQYANAFYFELVLKGLGNLGNSIGTYLQRTIPYYAPDS